MTLSRFDRVTVMVAAIAFIVIAVGMWVAPDGAAQRLGLLAADARGRATVRADLAGLFAGVATLCALAAWTRQRSWRAAGALMLALIGAGRVAEWIASGGANLSVGALAIELGLALALMGIRPDAPRAIMYRRKRSPAAWITTIAAIVVAAGAVSGALMRQDIGQELFDRAAADKARRTNTAPLADDALRVAICGSSAPLPSASRAKACVAVFAGGKFYIVDAGPESVENLVLWGVPLSSIRGVLLTHFHSDHIGDLGELNLQTWAAGRPTPLPVYGGPGVEQIVSGFNAAYALDQGYRTAHHSEQLMSAATWPMAARPIALAGPASAAKDRTGLVLQDGALAITAIEVDHAPIAPAYAYRFDYRGRSVVITGDSKYHAPLARAAVGADLLVSEAIATSMTRALGEGARSGGRDRTAAIMHDIEDYHLTPQQAAEIANEANVKHLVFYHLLPAPDGMLARRVFARGVDRVRRGGWTIADDGSLYTLPIGSSVIRSGRIDE